VESIIGMGRGFFFQAEDGIRDKLVTGVQTCALPILVKASRRACVGCSCAPSPALMIAAGKRSASIFGAPAYLWRITIMSGRIARSEERRVGKEWRSWWWAWAGKRK